MRAATIIFIATKRQSARNAHGRLGVIIQPSWRCLEIASYNYQLPGISLTLVAANLLSSINVIPTKNDNISRKINFNINVGRPFHLHYPVKTFMNARPFRGCLEGRGILSLNSGLMLLGTKGVCDV
jgi:hypothetical protein